jgi:hypothetical protein
MLAIAGKTHVAPTRFGLGVEFATTIDAQAFVAGAVVFGFVAFRAVLYAGITHGSGFFLRYFSRQTTLGDLNQR